MNKLMNFVFSEQVNVAAGLGVWARLVEKKKKILGWYENGGKIMLKMIKKRMKNGGKIS